MKMNRWCLVNSQLILLVFGDRFDFLLDHIPKLKHGGEMLKDIAPLPPNIEYRIVGEYGYDLGIADGQMYVRISNWSISN
jgi:hypothetical protein